MRKTLRVVGLVAALAFLVAPAVIGIVAERKQRNLIEHASTAGEPAVRLVAYDRGWFGAQSTLVYPMTGVLAGRLGEWLGESTGVDTELVIDSEIRHGPVAGASAGGVSVATSESTLSLRLGDRTVPLPGTVHSRLTAGGELTMRYLSGPGELSPSPDRAVRWASADVLGQFPGGGRLTASGVFTGLSLASGTASLALGDFELEGDFHRTRFGFWAGRSRVWTPVVLASTDTASFSARDVEVVSDQRLAADVANYRLTLAASSVGGKDWNGTDARVKLRVDGIDAQTFAGWVADPGARFDAAGMAAWQELLTPGASVTLETLSIPTKHGAVLADFGITLPESESDASMPAIAYLLTMEGQGRVEMPSRLAHALARSDPKYVDTLNRLLRMRMVRFTGRNYALEAAYGNGLLTVNGFPVPLPFVAH